METISITKRTIGECIKRRASVVELIEFMTAKESSLREYQREELRRAKWERLLLDDDIRMMIEAGRDYIYYRNDAVLKYEIGDLLFPTK